MKETTNTELMEKGNVVLNTMIEADGIYDLISFFEWHKKSVMYSNFEEIYSSYGFPCYVLFILAPQNILFC